MIPNFSMISINISKCFRYSSTGLEKISISSMYTRINRFGCIVNASMNDDSKISFSKISGMAIIWRFSYLLKGRVKED